MSLVRVSACPIPLPGMKVISLLAPECGARAKEIDAFLETKLWSDLVVECQNDAERSRGSLASAEDDASLRKAQIQAAIAGLPASVCIARMAAYKANSDPNRAAVLPDAVFKSETEIDARIAVAERTAEIITSAGYQQWARVMSEMAWAHHHMLAWCPLSDREYHQAWIAAICRWFGEIQKTVDLGVVAQAVREAQTRKGKE